MALLIGSASVPWRLDPEALRARMDLAAPISGFHWGKSTRASLRLFPTPVLDVDGLTLVDGSGKVVFESSTTAFGLSAPNLIVGRYVFLRARVKDPMAEIDLDAAAAAMPGLLKSPPVQRVQMRGGRLRLVSRRLGLNEELSPVSGGFVWRGENDLLSVSLGAAWRGQWTELEASLESPADFLAGLPSQASLDVSTAGPSMKLQGKLQLGDKPGFTGAATAHAQSLSRVATWLGLNGSKWADAEADVSGKVSLSPDMASLDDGTLGYQQQSFEGTASLTRGASGWAATATLAAEQLDLAKLIGSPPELLTPYGEWSRTPALGNTLPLDLDLRLSAADVFWGGASFVDAALVVQRQAGKASLKIIEAGYAGGGLNGEIDLSHCAKLCQARVSLTLANADLSTIMGASARNPLSGRATGELDVVASGDTPALLAATARGELRINATDGEIRGVNFEEALRHSQRRVLDLSRDLTVGKTSFHDLSAKLTFADGEAVFDDARLVAPGICLAGSGRIEISRRAWAATIDARQADSQGQPSPDGASISLGLNGPWRRPILSLSSRSD